jgi:hypothetical protein
VSNVLAETFVTSCATLAGNTVPSAVPAAGEDRVVPWLTLITTNTATTAMAASRARR